MEKPTCVYAADIAFLLESSDNINVEDFYKQKSLVISIARSFGISKNASRAAVVLYGDTASVHFRFEDSSSSATFVNAVLKMPHKKGGSRMDKAFEVAVKDVFPSGRVGIPKLAFVVSSGQKASDAKALGVASESLRRAGVKVVALGVGSKVSRDELRSVVDKEEDVWQADSYDQLILERKNISQKLCEEAGKLRGFLFAISFLAPRIFSK